MIEVNGMKYRTLQQSLYANGKKVLAAYCNGNLVYPEREDTQLLKVIGNINTFINHNHAGENPSCSANSGENYTYLDGDSYRAKGCFCLVMRNHSYKNTYVKSFLTFQETPTTIPDAKWPLNGSYSKRNGDIYTPGNAWLVYPYSGSTAPMLPTTGDGIHPLLGSDAMEAHAIYKSGGLMRATYSAELLLHLDVSAPRICPWKADKVYVGLGYPYLNATATPHKAYLNELPGDVNGFYRMYSYRHDTYYSLSWTKTGPTGKRFYVSLAPGNTKETGIYCSHLKIYISQDSSYGYPVTYTIRGTREGVYSEIEHTYINGFKILNIPITQLLYAGRETTAPEEHLHPRVEDLEPYI